MQLMSYIDFAGRDGWYYGNKKQFAKRHYELGVWIKEAIDYLNSGGVVTPLKKNE